ncbi:hypothetical protein KCU87_g463, partial [Aureobasidium melanogenum]
MPPPNVSDMRQVEVESHLQQRTGDKKMVRNEERRRSDKGTKRKEHLALPIFITAGDDFSETRYLESGTIKELECVLLEDAERGVRTTPTRTTTARAATNQIIAVAQMSAMRKHQKASNDSRRSFLQVHARYATSCDLPHYLASDFIVQNDRLPHTRNPKVKQEKDMDSSVYTISTHLRKITVLYRLTTFDSVSLIRASNDAHPSGTCVVNDLIESTLLCFSCGSQAEVNLTRATIVVNKNMLVLYGAFTKRREKLLVLLELLQP